MRENILLETQNLLHCCNINILRLSTPHFLHTSHYMPLLEFMAIRPYKNHAGVSDTRVSFKILNYRIPSLICGTTHNTHASLKDSREIFQVMTTTQVDCIEPGSFSNHEKWTILEFFSYGAFKNWHLTVRFLCRYLVNSNILDVDYKLNIL